jgi:hypothetical protein
MPEQITMYLYGTGITNTFVMYFSAIMLAFLSALKSRRFLFGWLSPWSASKRLIRIFRLLPLSLGIVVLLIVLDYSNPLYLLNLTGNGYFYCSTACYTKFELDFLGWISSCLLLLVGAITSIDWIFPGEPSLR